MPFAMVSGDDKACAEAQKVCPNVECAVVKEGFSRTSSIMYAPAKSRELVREGARKAMAVIPNSRTP